MQFNDDIKDSAQETLKTGHELQKQKAARKNIKDAIFVSGGDYDSKWGNRIERKSSCSGSRVVFFKLLVMMNGIQWCGGGGGGDGRC